MVVYTDHVQIAQVNNLVSPDKGFEIAVAKSGIQPYFSDGDFAVIGLYSWDLTKKSLSASITLPLQFGIDATG